jgi:hypothetical protein
MLNSEFLGTNEVTGLRTISGAVFQRIIQKVQHFAITAPARRNVPVFDGPEKPPMHILPGLGPPEKFIVEERGMPADQFSGHLIGEDKDAVPRGFGDLQVKLIVKSAVLFNIAVSDGLIHAVEQLFHPLKITIPGFFYRQPGHGHLQVQPVFIQLVNVMFGK